MSEFEVICNYNKADETINFGSRSLDGDTLYEAFTLASLNYTATNTNSEPSVKTAVAGCKLFASLDNTIIIFTDKDCTDIEFTCKFESCVDTFCVDSAGSVLIIGERNGNVKVFHKAEEYSCIYKKNFDVDPNNEVIFIDSYVVLLDGCYHAFIVASNGLIYRLIIDLDNRDTISCEEFYDFEQRATLCIFAPTHLILNGSRHTSIIDIEDRKNITVGSLPLKKAYPLDTMFLALLEDKTLARICVFTFFSFPIEKNDRYEDIILVTDKDKVHILAATEKNETGASFIQLLSYPDFSTLFSFSVAADFRLVPLESITDEPCYISRIYAGDSSVKELHIHKIYEAVPVMRLKKLLQKGLFEEAEKFAEKFKIDPVVILKAKAQNIVDRMNFSLDDVEMLLGILKGIDDDEFGLECCLEVEISSCSLEALVKVFAYGQKLVFNFQKPTPQQQSLIMKSMELHYRFHTFLLLEYDVEKWQEFSECHLIFEVKRMLREHEIERAVILYNRFDENTLEDLDENDMEEILNILNSLQMPLSFYKYFLSTFIPLSLDRIPSSLTIFIDWLTMQIYELERKDSSNFPQNGLEFLQTFTDLLKIKNSSTSLESHVRVQDNSLNELQEALEVLKTLKENYHISIPLWKYLKGPKPAIRAFLGLELHPEIYEKFLEEFLSNYIVQHHLDIDEVLFHEIKDMLTYREVYWINIVQPVLNCIGSVELKVKAVNVILSTAKLPWCETVRKIAWDALQYENSSVEEEFEIKEKIENEPILVVLSKSEYDIRDKSINDACDVEFLVNRMIYCETPSLIADAFQLCSADKSYRSVIMRTLCAHFVKIGKHDVANSILDNNPSEDALKCLDYLLNKASCLIDHSKAHFDMEDSEVKNYYDALESISSKYRRFSRDPFHVSLVEDTVKNLKNVYNLQRTFGKTFGVSQLLIPKLKAEALDDIMQDIVYEFEVEQNLILALDQCDKVTNYLSLDKEQVLISFCQKVNSTTAILKIAEKILDASTDTKYLCLAALFLFQNVNTSKSSLSETTFDTSALLIKSVENCAQKIDDFVEALKLAGKLATKALVNCTFDEMQPCLEVLNWINSVYFLTRKEKDTVENFLFPCRFDLGNSAVRLSDLATVQQVFELFSHFIEQYNHPNTKFLTYYNSNRQSIFQEDLIQQIKYLPPVIESLCRNGQQMTAFKVVTVLEHSLANYATNIDPAIYRLLHELLVIKCVREILQAAILPAQIDKDFTYTLLLIYPKGDALNFIMKTLKFFRSQPKKILSLSQVGIKLLTHYDMLNDGRVWQDIIINMKWWEKFDKCVIKYEEFFKIKPSQRLELLIDHGYITLELLEEYCTDYKLPAQVYLVIFLKKVLLNWKPKYEVSEDITGRRSLIVRSQSSELLAKCREILLRINKKDESLDLLLKFWSTINYYYYEVFLCIFNLWEEFWKNEENPHHQKMSMLLFLRTYQRSNKPSEREVEHWFSQFPDTQNIEALSEFRLPFSVLLFTNDIWTIIRPEISLQNYKNWFSLVVLSKYITADDICSYLIKGVVSSGVLQVSASKEWNLYPKYTNLFEEIDECMQHIESLELRTSVAYHLLANTPEGADQVTIAKITYNHAKIYKHQQPQSPKVQQLFTKIEKKYHRCSALQVLHKYRLVEKKYIDILLHPEDLIISLYHDHRIIDKFDNLCVSCPSINEATDELGKIFEVDVSKIRFNMVINWLQDLEVMDFNSTHQHLGAPMDARKTGKQSENNLKRAAYICANNDVLYWQTYLYNEAFASANKETNIVFQARALKCLCVIADEETIEKISSNDYHKILLYKDELTLLSYLENLSFSMTMEDLRTCNKKDLLRRLAQLANPVSIKAMGSLCSIYHLDDIKYWKYVVNMAIKFDMISELELYVQILRNKKCNYQKFYIDAWQKLIDSAWQNISLTGSELVKGVLLIQSCPVLSFLNIEGAVKKCFNQGKAEFGVILLQYLPIENRDSYIKDLTYEELLPKMKKLKENGIAGIAVAEKIFKVHLI